MPEIYHYLDKDFQSFFDELAITNNTKFFEKKSIQTLIDFNYLILRRFIIAFLFAPFLVYHILFVIWANDIYQYMLYNNAYSDANIGIIIVLLIFSAYFLSNEIRQIYREGLDYILSVWNYIDIIGPAGVVFTCILALLQYRGHEIQIELTACVQSITTLFMWIKVLYFMRIFRHTGYLIRMLIEVLSDMSTFLLVLLITLTAFGDAFLKMS